ncbi:DUF1499 domain-containing protein [Qipengyuania sp. JC766]|uniref:DUF1499 domain-containing protein n=1 Tax=Qipengyuania sp. JC766 TaxID=3232139 RepID=UPI003458863A
MKRLAALLPRIALVLAILLPLWFLVASLGAKWGWWPKLFGFGTMTATMGPLLAMGIGALGVVALLVSLLVKPRRGWWMALIAILVPLVVMGGFSALRSQAESVPRIYDLTTDPADPPAYSAAMIDRREADGANELMVFDTPLGQLEKWEGSEIGETGGELIRTGYPDLATGIYEADTESALDAIEAAMEMRGFDDVTRDDAAGTIEGTDELFWYGFRDDVVARVRPAGEGRVEVDFRSTSRLGLSDLGVNAQRIADLRAALADRLGDPTIGMEPGRTLIVEDGSEEDAEE